MLHRKQMGKPIKGSHSLKTEQYLLLNKVVTGFKELYQNQELCDYAIQTSDGICFQVHKCYMAAVCDYFKAMLTGTMVESRSETVELKNVTAAGLKPVLDHFYGIEDIHIPDESIFETLNAAELLQAKCVLSKCSQKICDVVSKENVLDILQACNMYSLDAQVREAIDELIVPRKSYHFSLPDKLDAEDVEYYILRAAGLNIQTSLIFKGVREWMEGDLANRKQYSLQVMQHVSFPLMKPEELEEVMTVDLVKEIPECVSFIEEAKHYQSQTMHMQVLLQSPRTVLRGNASVVVLAKKHELDGIEQMLYLDERVHRYGKWWALPEPNLELKEVKIVVVNNFLLVCDTQTSKCYLFDPRFLKWEELGSLESTYRCFSLVTHGSDVFTIGGHMGPRQSYHRRHLYDSLGKHGSGSVDIINKYCFQENKWKRFSALFEEVESLAVGTEGPYIYIAGGETFHDNIPGVTSNMFCRMEVSTGNIEKLPSVLNLENYVAHKMVILKDKIFLIQAGGKYPKIFNMVTQKWSEYQSVLMNCMPYEEEDIIREGGNLYYISRCEYTHRILRSVRKTTVEELGRKLSDKTELPYRAHDCAACMLKMPQIHQDLVDNVVRL